MVSKRKLLYVIVFFIFTVWYGEYSREKGFKQGVTVGKVRTLINEGYPQRDIVNRLTEPEMTNTMDGDDEDATS